MMPPPLNSRPRVRVGLSRPVSVTPKRMPTQLEEPPNPCQQLPTKQPVQHPSPSNASCSTKERLYFSVLYTKRSKKKHKSWLDGYVIVKNDRHVQLLNEDGKSVSSERCLKPLGGLKSGNTLEVSSWELDVQNEVSEDDYVSGRLFAPPAPFSSTVKRPKQKPFIPLRSTSLPSNQPDQQPIEKAAAPMHDPSVPDAVVLLPASNSLNDNILPIVLDPFITRRMRPHQIEGVKFLFDCTAGRARTAEDNWQGAILADEMGLGKSLQAIALIWTLLKQGTTSGKPLAKKAIIVCPASLVKNWENEVRKWLGDERLRPVALESGVSSYESKESLASFFGGNIRKLLIISYEMFRSNTAQLYQVNCGLIICDEGHRLKSAGGNKTIDALRKFPCRRRVILTGTPVQNDLEEFYAVCDFVNPGCLNSLNSFRSVFANPIIVSRDSNATPNAKKIGEARAKQLSHITAKFVLRRTSNILEKYLPPKTETAIFCNLHSNQKNKYEREAHRRYVEMINGEGMTDALRAINVLRKICIHPSLVDNHISDEEVNFERPECHANLVDDAFPLKSEPQNIVVKESAKMQVTSSICDACKTRGDRVIVVSNFTTVLDLLEVMLEKKVIKYCRLDGSTPVAHRGNIVRRFNEGSLGEVFLLSAKAGGVGLNLIGANRLILFDPDWNPATDIQAMARVWRDGQKKHVYIYRLLCTGTIEEKIFQRQLFKGELQSAVDGNSDLKDDVGMANIGRDGNFKAEELRDVFKYTADVEYCETLNVLERSKEDKRKAGLLEQFKRYKDIADKENVAGAVWCEEDDVLNRALNADVDTHGTVSYLYTKVIGVTMERDVDSINVNRRVQERTDVEKRKRPRDSRRSGKKCVETQLDTNVNEATVKKPKIEDRNDVKVVQRAETQVVDLTWDDAINDLDYDC